MSSDSDRENNLQEDEEIKCEKECSENPTDAQSSQQSPHIRSPKAVIVCEVCTKVPSKYTCPGCGVKTCSLPCVKEHKIKLFCSGERDQFAFVDKSQYSDRQLLNDYRFLENAERSVYSNKLIVPRNKFTSLNMPYPSKRVRILASAAQRRGIHLTVMPNSLSRHKSNTSFYTISSDVIEWHIEWLFVSSNCLVKDEKVPESKIIRETAEKFSNAVDYPHLRKSLEDYRKHFDKCRFLIKVEGLPANRKRFIELNPESSFRDNLKGVSLVEYPTILVMPPSYYCGGYPLLDKDTDLVHMDRDHMRHLTQHHPDFVKHLQDQLLDPNSSLYRADDVINVDA